ncbi:hypothetical protein BKH43_06860 [Helicobacter sp. 13S00401-1]|uniref:hypothetical protein n=1 Tax=Helicobacter sp. 13S00401-1 TaxID=1905758 RepID=UPI000BA5584E|nr:hypothetical protein [Helicobacter sp. 13S00401-1]PAF49363.1 hypothetical protein BKH43_06860 [Helicobacter sp. 13S00401-1]
MIKHTAIAFSMILTLSSLGLAKETRTEGVSTVKKTTTVKRYPQKRQHVGIKKTSSTRIESNTRKSTTKSHLTNSKNLALNDINDDDDRFIAPVSTKAKSPYPLDGLKLVLSAGVGSSINVSKNPNSPSSAGLDMNLKIGGAYFAPGTFSYVGFMAMGGVGASNLTSVTTYAPQYFISLTFMQLFDVGDGTAKIGYLLGTGISVRSLDSNNNAGRGNLNKKPNEVNEPASIMPTAKFGVINFIKNNQSVSAEFQYYFVNPDSLLPGSDITLSYAYYFGD